jgi:hypothetical protein
VADVAAGLAVVVLALGAALGAAAELDSVIG